MVFGQTEGQSSDMNTLDILNFKFDVVKLKLGYCVFVPTVLGFFLSLVAS